MICLKNKKTNSTKEAIIISLKISHLLASGVLLLLLAAIFLLPADILIKLSPQCELKTKEGVECFFCGMTRAFMEISNIDFVTAIKYNVLSIPLFLLFIVNEIFTAVTLKKRLKKITNRYRILYANN